MEGAKKILLVVEGRSPVLADVVLVALVRLLVIAARERVLVLDS